MGRGVRDRRGESVIRFVAPGRVFYPDRLLRDRAEEKRVLAASIRSVRTWNPEECRSRFFSLPLLQTFLSYVYVLRRRSLGVLCLASRRECKIIALAKRISYKRSKVRTISSRRIEVNFRDNAFRRGKIIPN